MVYRLYDLIMTLAAAILFPYALYKGARYGRLWEGVCERLAIYAPQRLQPFAGKRLLWVHAVSVGEVRACLPLLKELRQANPDAVLLLSCMTFTGKEIGQSLEEVDLCIFLPFDISFLVKRALRQLQPQAVLLVETEIWPNLVRLVSQRGIPLLMVNGRISDRSFPRYLMVKRFLAPLLGNFTHFCMQSRMDALRIVRLGAASEAIEVTGNMKFDLPAPDFSSAEVKRICSDLALPEARLIWVAGSTRQGEEQLVLEAFTTLLAKGQACNLVLVPRYPERADSVAELVVAAGLEPILRSSVTGERSSLSPEQVLIVDTLGEMLKLYACADVVFVGGSLVPIGGHNVLEASMLGKPVLFGPHTQNIKQIAGLLLEAEGGVRVVAANLAGEVERLLLDKDLRERIGQHGAAVYAEHAGAARRTFEALRNSLGAS